MGAAPRARPHVIVYFSGVDPRLADAIGPHPCAGLLSTFAAQKPALDLLSGARRNGWHAFLDSGAFSAFTLGEQINVEDYADFLDRHGRSFDLVASLDVIGDPDATARNFLRLCERGHDYVVPTFHYSFRWDALDRLVAASPRIALGGMARFARTVTNRKPLRSWLDAAFRRIPRGTLVHGFGVSGLDMLMSYPWDSVDSTTASWGLKRGFVLTGRGGNVRMTMFSNLKSLTIAERLASGASFKDFDGTRLRKQSASHAPVTVANARAILSVAEGLTAHRGVA